MDGIINAYKKDVDRTLLIENLKLSHQQRLEKFEKFMEGVMELRNAKQKTRQDSPDRDRVH